MTCGIYILKFKDTDRVYIGQSINIENRYTVHLRALRKGTHARKLQEAYLEFGEPSIEILQECSEEDLDVNENEAISIYNSALKGLNTKDSAGHRPSLRGEDWYCSTVSNDTVREVFNTLVSDTTLRAKEIAEIFGISPNVVKDVRLGNSHRWLAEEYPEKYYIMLREKGTRNSGQNCATSEYSNNQIEQIFNMILDNNNTLVSISESTGVDYNTVKSIASGTNHKWLSSKYPDRYAEMLSLKGRGNKRSAKDQGIQYPNIVSPSGDVFEVTNIRGFAKEHNLNQGHLGAVLRGKEKQHKGWRLQPSNIL